MNITESIRSAIWDVTTSLVADTIALWSPEKANIYRRNRELYKRSYVAANLKGPYQGHRPSNVSGDAAVLAKRVAVTARVRDMERNNPLVAGMIAKRTTCVIGDEVGMKSQIVDAKKTPMTEINQTFEERFYAWCESACADGRSLTDACDLVENHLALDGEVIVRDAFESVKKGNPYRIQVLETDYLNASNGIYGVEYTPAGKPLRFHLFTSHPAGVKVESRETVAVSAEECLLVAETTRSSQQRGISPLASAVYKLYGVDDLEDAELVASRSACAYGLVITSPLADVLGAETAGGGTDDAGNDREYMDSGGILRLKNGETVTPFKNERPNSNFESFIRGRQRSAAGAAQISYETATGDYSQVNYSSARMGRLVEWANIRRRQRRIRRILNWIYRKWLKYEITVVGIPGVSASEYKNNPSRFEAVSWQLAGNDGIDPVKEINAFETELSLGVNSRTRFAAERGRDLREVAKEIAEEKAFLKSLGIFQEDPSVTTSSTVSKSESKSVTETADSSSSDSAADNTDHSEPDADETQEMMNA